MEKQRIYIIPTNYTETGKVFNLEKRNIVEAVILTLALFLTIKALPIGFTPKLSMYVFLCFPLLVIGSIGIRGYSLSQYFFIYLGDTKGKRTLRYRRIIKRLTKEEMIAMGYDNKKKKTRKVVKVEDDADEEDEEVTAKSKLKAEFKGIIESIIPQNARTSKNKQHFVQELIPIDKIENGVIFTQDNRYVKILEIMPNNMQGLSDDEINDIGMTYEEWVRISPVNMQIKIISQKKTSFEYIEMIKKYVESEKVPQAREMGLNYARHIKELTQHSGITRRAFLIFEYEKEGLLGDNDMDEVYQQLYRREVQIQKVFVQMGNKVKSFSEGNQDYYLHALLYELLNRKTSIIEDYKDRELRVRNDVAKVRKINPGFVCQIPTRDLISPRGIDLNNPDYIVVDGVYTSYFAIDASSYPQRVGLSWMEYFINAGEGYDIDIFTQREDTTKTLERIQRKITTNQIDYKDANASSNKQNSLETVISSGFFIQEQLSQYGENFFYTTVMITVRGDSRKDMEKKKHELKALFKRRTIGYAEFKHQKEDCFLSTLPLCKIEKTIFEKNKRNMLTQSVASMYPFSSYELVDQTGVAIGIATNGSVVYLNLFNKNKLNNANMFVVGGSGSGKSYFISTLAMRMRLMQIKTIIIAPFKGYEFQPACTALGGSFVKLEIGTKDCINVMDILVVETKHNNYEDEVKNPIARKIENIITFISLIYPELTNKERNLLDGIIKQTYAKKGIHLNDPTSIFLNGNNGIFKEMPILGDLQEEVSKNLLCDGITNALEPYVNGRLSSFNQQTNVDLKNKYTVIDVSKLSEDLLSVGMFVATTFASENIEADRTEKKAIIFDEAWRVLNSSTDKSGAVGGYVQSIAKTIRGMGGSAIFATQDIKDLIKNERALSILTQCETKMILKLEKSEAELTQEIVGLSDDEVHLVKKATKGFGLLCAGRNRIAITILASKMEHDLIDNYSDKDIDSNKKAS